MPNIIDANGVTIATLQENVLLLENIFKDIYGNEINLEPDTQDGQLIHILAQKLTDLGEYALMTNASFDRDQAQGRILDLRLLLSGITRKEGVRSATNINITINRRVVLHGRNEQEQNFIVEDENENRWRLVNTHDLSSQSYPATFQLLFEAMELGPVIATQNTITKMVTVLAAIDSVNNPDAQTIIGTNEESDSEAKERARQSVSLSAQGYADAMRAALKNLTGMNDAWVYENKTSIERDNIPPHGIWVVTDGTASDEEIAQAIYRKRGGGENIKEGGKFFDIEQNDGNFFRVHWDEVALNDIFIRFNLTSINPSLTISNDYIKTQLASRLRPLVGKPISINDVSRAIQEIDSNALVTNIGLSREVSGTYENILTANLNARFNIKSSNVIALPMQIVPTAIQNVVINESYVFSGSGGYGSYTYTLMLGSGTIDSVTGEFVGTSVGTCTIRVTDALGNYAEKIIQVTSG